MAIRSYFCEKCGQETDELFWQEYPRCIQCPQCGSKAFYRISDTKFKGRQPKRHKVAFQDGWDIGAGRWFNTQKERDRWLVETNSTYRKDI